MNYDSATIIRCLMAGVVVYLIARQTRRIWPQDSIEMRVWGRWLCVLAAMFAFEYFEVFQRFGIHPRKAMSVFLSLSVLIAMLVTMASRFTPR